ncbi:MAG: hypothetical protein LBB26_00520 [Puniceicoccales bacterium]|nr:hypothetical protein [Puniceicoccales bacterium]
MCFRPPPQRVLLEQFLRYGLGRELGEGQVRMAARQRIAYREHAHPTAVMRVDHLAPVAARRVVDGPQLDQFGANLKDHQGEIFLATAD